MRNVYAWFVFLGGLLTAGLTYGALSDGERSVSPSQIVILGTVPDESTKVAIIEKLRQVYGANQVVDQITVGTVVLPANWTQHVQQLIVPELKQIHHGQLRVDGTLVHMKGEVANEALRQQVTSHMATTLNANYTINNGLRVSSADQAVLDKTLANRIIEFNVNNAVLTEKGQAILHELIGPLRKMKGKHVEVIGHTDNSGNRSANILLSKARAESVKEYLVNAGFAPEMISTSGVGPDNPVASNESADGRARNRRIEFRVVENAL